jgi:hypothetical protein
MADGEGQITVPLLLLTAWWGERQMPPSSGKRRAVAEPARSAGA